MAGRLLQELKDKVARFNALNADDSGKIPVANSILDDKFADKDFCSSLFAMNNITQIQLYLATLQQESGFPPVRPATSS